MEAPPVGPFSYVPAIPQAVPLTPAQIAISNVSISEEPSRAKMRRVTQENGDVRIPTPFVNHATRQFNRYLAFIQQYPQMGDQLVALRTTLDEHEIREELVFELTEADRIDDALHFYLEMQACPERKEFFSLYCQDLIKNEAKVKALIDKINTFQPHALELFIFELACAYFDASHLTHVNDIFCRLKAKKVSFLLYIISKISSPFIAAPAQTAAALNQFPEPLREELFYVFGMTLIKYNQIDMTSHFIGFMNARKNALITLINNHNNK